VTLFGNPLVALDHRATPQPLGIQQEPHRPAGLEQQPERIASVPGHRIWNGRILCNDKL
jgi:hypothetical protein